MKLQPIQVIQSFALDSAVGKGPKIGKWTFGSLNWKLDSRCLHRLLFYNIKYIPKYSTSSSFICLREGVS